MKTTLLIFFIILLLVGCDDYPKEQTVTEDRLNCAQDTVEARSAFILSCLSKANPKSDEEPEDWIKFCQTMAEETICTYQSLIVTQQIMCIGCGWHDKSLTPVPESE